MHKNTLWLFLVLLLVYLTFVYCTEAEAFRAGQNNNNRNVVVANLRTDIEEGRKRHGLYHHAWGWHALAIAYWVKVKLVIVGFFVGSAIFVGLRYYWPHKCGHGEIYRESPVIFDHPPSFAHDHGSYSHDDTSGPYSSYSDVYSSDASGPSTGPDTHHVKRRSTADSTKQQAPRQLPHRRQPMPTEEQIGEIMFYFLGLDTGACRRRFICEMEFRSRLHPMTSMAFRIVGRGFFGKYTNARNELGQATSFAECASVNAECVFIEQEEQEGELSAPQEESETAQPETVDPADNEVAANDMELENATNLLAERRDGRHRRRGGHQADLVARRILGVN